MQVGLGGATGLGLGVGNLAGSGLSGRGGLEGLSLGSLIGGLQQHGLPSGNRDRIGESQSCSLSHIGAALWSWAVVWRWSRTKPRCRLLI